MKRLKEKGAYLEYYRNDKQETIHNYIKKNQNNCDYKTYQKIICGKCNVESIYDDLYINNDIEYNCNIQDKDTIVKIISVLYDAMIHMELAEKVASIYKQAITIEIHSYPYRAYLDFIIDFCQFNMNRKQYDKNFIKKYYRIFEFFEYKLRICFYYLEYQCIHYFTQDIHLIDEVVKRIPEEYDENEIILKMRMDSHKYVMAFDTSIQYGEKLIKKCKETNNIHLLLDVYQSFHGIYAYLKQEEKALYYMNRLDLYTSLQIDSIQPSVREKFLYYIGMNYFNQHNFEKAFPIIDELIKKDKKKYVNLILPFLHITDSKDHEFIYQCIDVLSSLNDRSKKEASFYTKKYGGYTKNKLKNYLLDKVFLMLNKNHVMEYHIFLEELYELGFVDETKKLIQYFKKQNYPINEQWFSER